MPGFNSLLNLYKEIVIDEMKDNKSLISILENLAEEIAYHRIYIANTEQKEDFAEWKLSQKLTIEIETKVFENSNPKLL